MKKFSFTILASFFVFSLFASSPLDFQYVHSMNKARSEYDHIQEILSNAAILINKKGEKAFADIRKINEKEDTDIFVIDPTSGEILISPPAESIGKNALKNSAINGKAIVREAILKAQTELYGSNWEIWTNSVGEVYNKYITQIAITLDGKVYALAIGKENETLQRLFVTKLVDNACTTLKDLGTEKAFKIFDKENSIYRFKNTYIFVYELNSPDNIVCLYNPNYPQYIGKNMTDYKVKSGYIIKDIYNKLDKYDSSWIKSEALIPGTKKTESKDIYVKAISINGKKYAVGSGVYLAN